VHEIKVRPNHLLVDEYERAVARIAVDEVAPAPHLLTRVARVCCTNPEVHKQSHGYEWGLDMSNDWKMERKGDHFVVAYRYGGGGNAKFMEALEVVLNHLLS